MQVKIFSDYYLRIDIKSNFITVVSKKRNEEKIIKPAIRSRCAYYRLYQGGVKTEYTLKQLIQLAIPSITLS